MANQDYLSESPFTQWIQTSSTIPGSEQYRLNNFLRKPLLELVELEAQMNALAARHAEVKAAVEAHQALLCYIRILPSEILGCIFLACLPEDHLPSLHAPDMLEVIPQVCGAWRAVALAAPQLWSSIEVKPISELPSGKPCPAFYVRRLERWFKTALPLPLTISITSSSAYALKGPDRLLFDTILAHQSRVHELRFEASEPLIIHFGRHECSWSALHRIVLNMDGVPQRYASDDVMYETDYLWRAVNLKRVEWSSVEEDITSSDFRWGQMEEISTSSTYPYNRPCWPNCPFHARVMLQASPNLVKLGITLDGTEDEDEQNHAAIQKSFKWSKAPLPPIGAPVTLQRLTTLALVDTYVDPSIRSAPTTIFLRELYLPALTSLEYHLRLSGEEDSDNPTSPPPSSADSHPLVGFMRSQQQPSKITHWTISFTSICRADFLECLKLMPALEELWLNDGGLLRPDGSWPKECPLSQDVWHVVPDDSLLDAFWRCGTTRFGLSDVRIDAGYFTLQGIQQSLTSMPSPLTSRLRLRIRAFDLETEDKKTGKSVGGVAQPRGIQDEDLRQLMGDCQALGVELDFALLSMG